MVYFYAFGLSLLLALLSTPLLIKLAQKLDILDYPHGRHQHAKPTPLLGGVVIFIAFIIPSSLFMSYLTATDLRLQHWLAVFIGATLLIIGGVLDDRYTLKPLQQVMWPILAALVLTMGGVGIEKVTNPFGGLLYLESWQIPILTLYGHTYVYSVLADTFTILWIIGMIYTTKLLDGVDGLVSGLGVIASVIIFLFTLTSKYYQPDISLAAIILAGAILGFFYYNWHPAKIFLGESGSMLIGFLLGVLSIISGGKIAIALLIMGIPIMDVAWTIIQRLIQGHNPFKTADRQHLHYKLLDSGLSIRQTVVIFYALALIFGGSALFLQSIGKMIAISLLLVIMLIFVVIFYWLDKKRKLS